MGFRKFTIIGGDLRSIKLANILVEGGNKVNIFGFKKAGFELGMEESEDLRLAIDESDVVVGPLPCSNDNETINAPFHTDKIYINDVFKIMSKNQLFLAGRISDKIVHLSQIYNVYAIDILEREEMAILNAIPTAEGAIQIAMEELPITLHDCNALVLGYGRIGKILSKMLKGIGANVFVEARKCADIAWIKGNGYHPVNLSELKNTLSKMDVVFNTIPYMILNIDLLNEINKECVVIDLASKPGGVDFEKAKDLGIRVIWALSLPGKVAPVTAAKFIKETVYNVIDELGV
ncbi:MAG TPA: dipicolinate synthase subunit DpsA [Clostridia bacterium]|nr:dipicolinate synthase subunit DpsA [Clostridia bacterium]